MKKISTFLFICMLGITMMGITAQSFSQTTTTPATAATTSAPDFFAGKWEITITGTPQGDAKMVTELVRKDGKLSGQLKDPSGTNPAMPITRITEDTGKVITIYFDTAQAGEIGVELAKVDDDHLKGQLMSMFDATAVRIK